MPASARISWSENKMKRGTVLTVPLFLLFLAEIEKENKKIREKAPEMPVFPLTEGENA